jgi:hypothetical protein
VSRRSILAARVLVAGAILTGLPGRAALSPALERLLAASDPFAAAPAELRLTLVFEGANGARVPLEIWRKGDDLALVRFLAPRDLGKFVLRRGDQAWLLAPGAKNPVRLSPALAPAAGAALDELLGLRLARDYRATDAREENGVVTFDLEAARAGVEPPRVRWVVDRERRLPLRAEFRAADGKVRRLVEFKSWRDPKQLVPEQIVAKDVLRGAPLTVWIGRLEARAVPGALFDLADGSARRSLPPPDPDELPSADGS